MLETLPQPLEAQAWPPQGAWTYDDYLRLPEDGQRYEIIEGVLYVTNAPSAAHQFVVLEIVRQMANFVVEQQLGQVLPAPFEVHLSETTRPVQPDILFVKADRWPGGDIQFFEGAPDLIVEVLSPSSVRRDRHIKFAAYEQAGVTEYWIANPTLCTVEVYTLSGGEYAVFGQYAGEDIIKSALLEGVEIVNRTLFNQC